MLYSPQLGLLMQMIRSSSVISIFANKVFLVRAEEGALNSTANEGFQILAKSEKPFVKGFYAGTKQRL